MGDGTKFQCSSASRKFLNASSKRPLPRKPLRFSALQRAENSSMQRPAPRAKPADAFQCSSASRKFLNSSSMFGAPILFACFSALQRAENSSILELPNGIMAIRRVSVLFSEPKIPQSDYDSELMKRLDSFSALQRAENSSIVATLRAAGADCCFSALQRAENSSMPRARDTNQEEGACFSALQRAENSSIQKP